MFATRLIRKGSQIIEYLGERISHEEANRRHAKKKANDNHTFLFTVDSKTVIDGGVNGNEARFINHSCEPNCEVYIEDGRLLIEAARTIRPGEELVYDYIISRSPDDPPNVDEIFKCLCGTQSCRGSMLEPKKKPRAKKKTGARKKTKRTASTVAKAKSAGRTAARRTKGEASATRKTKANGAKRSLKRKQETRGGKPKRSGTARKKSAR